jgi:Flp pilus assembly protein CpaB
MRHSPAPDSHDLQRRPVDRLLTALSGHRRGGRRARAVRRMAAVALLVGAAVLATAGPSPAARGGTVVQVASRDLPAGATLQPPDLRTSAIPSPPDGALPATPAPIGRVLAAPVRQGEILTDVRLLDSGGPRPGPGRVAVPVRPDDAGTVSLLQPGMRVAVIGVQADGTARTLTGDAVVLWVPDAGTDTGVVAQHEGRLVVLSVPKAVADAVAATAITGSIGIRFA